jgi:hypothetical protein
MSHTITIPDELYRAIEEFAARHGETAEAAILAWAESLVRSGTGTTPMANSEPASRVDDPRYDPWAGFRGATEAMSADSVDRHDVYLAEDYLANHEPDQ